MKSAPAFLVAFVAATCLAAEYARYVDVFTGTAATGHTTPAAAYPLGMLQVGPDTGTGEWKYCSGYQYADDSVLGYSLNHLSGTGCPDYGDVRILPFTGETRSIPMRSRIDKRSETACPGFYSVLQSDDGVQVDLAAALRAAMMRFTWRKPGARKVLVDLGAVITQPWANGRTSLPEIRMSDDDFIVGAFRKDGWIENRTVGFAIQFDRCWKRCEKLESSAGSAPAYVLEFDIPEGHPLLVEVALSTVGGEGARANLESSLREHDFETVRRGALAAWDGYLSRFKVEGSETEKTNFYTAAYHLFFQPNEWIDYNNTCRNADGSFCDACREGTFLTTLSLWDTFRAAEPLYTIVAPEVVSSTIRSLLMQYRAAGRLPVMSYGGRNVDCMIGNHAVPVIADAWLKGFRSFDAELAWEAVTNTLTVEHLGKPKEDWEIYNRYGYFPFDLINGESVSRTLECSYDDWCAARFAEALGKTDEATFFAKRAENWKNVFDVSVGFARGKDTKGAWRDPFDPFLYGHGADTPNDFTEGNAFQYSWHVMQDPDGLIAAMGGRDRFAAKLDSLFMQPRTTEGEGLLCDVTGLIGQYVHGNEPSHHVIYFYPLIGEPDKAAERIREVFDRFYMPGPEGLCGNDDCGQMSAWYIFSAMGFYPFNPCCGEYVIGAPQLPKVTLSTRSSRSTRPNTFTVIAKNLSKENKYVKSVTLNGKPITDWKIRHSDIMADGELVFEMKGK